eukprot:g36973.t1
MPFGKDELREIGSALIGKSSIQGKERQTVLDVHFAVTDAMSNNLGRFSSFNLRDVQRVQAVYDSVTKAFGSPTLEQKSEILHRALRLVYLEGFVVDSQEREVVEAVLEAKHVKKFDTQHAEAVLQGHDIILGCVKIRKLQDVCVSPEPFLVNRATPHLLKSLELLAMAYLSKRMTLLTGPACSAKSSLPLQLAHLIGHRSVVIPMHKSLDMSDLLGGFVSSTGPNVHDSAKAFCNQIASHLNRLDCMRLARSVAALAKIDTDKELTPQEILAELAPFNDKSGGLEALLKSFQPKSKLLFHFVPGSVMEAIKTGAYCILENVNLIRPEVLERLNSLGEHDARLYFMELGMNHLSSGRDEDQVDAIRPHPDFRLVCTAAQDREGAQLSSSFQNRCIVINLESLDSPKLLQEDIPELLQGLYGSPAPEIMKNFCTIHSRVKKPKTQMTSIVVGYKHTFINLCRAVKLFSERVPVKFAFQLAYGLQAPPIESAEEEELAKKHPTPTDEVFRKQFEELLGERQRLMRLEHQMLKREHASTVWEHASTVRDEDFMNHNEQHTFDASDTQRDEAKTATFTSSRNVMSKRVAQAPPSLSTKPALFRQPSASSSILNNSLHINAEAEKAISDFALQRYDETCRILRPHINYLVNAILLERNTHFPAYPEQGFHLQPKPADGCIVVDNAVMDAQAGGSRKLLLLHVLCIIMEAAHKTWSRFAVVLSGQLEKGRPVMLKELQAPFRARTGCMVLQALLGKTTRADLLGKSATEPYRLADPVYDWVVSLTSKELLSFELQGGLRAKRSIAFVRLQDHLVLPADNLAQVMASLAREQVVWEGKVSEVEPESAVGVTTLVQEIKNFLDSLNDAVLIQKREDSGSSRKVEATVSSPKVCLVKTWPSPDEVKIDPLAWNSYWSKLLRMLEIEDDPPTAAQSRVVRDDTWQKITNPMEGLVAAAAQNFGLVAPNVYTAFSESSRGKIVSLRGILNWSLMDGATTKIWLQKNRGGRFSAAFCIALDLSTPTADLISLALGLIEVCRRRYQQISIIVFSPHLGVRVVSRVALVNKQGLSKLLELLDLALQSSCDPTPVCLSALQHAIKLVSSASGVVAREVWLLTAGGFLTCLSRELQSLVTFAENGLGVQVRTVGVGANASPLIHSGFVSVLLCSGVRDLPQVVRLLLGLDATGRANELQCGENWNALQSKETPIKALCDNGHPWSLSPVPLEQLPEKKEPRRYLSLHLEWIQTGGEDSEAEPSQNEEDKKQDMSLHLEWIQTGGEDSEAEPSQNEEDKKQDMKKTGPQTGSHVMQCVTVETFVGMVKKFIKDWNLSDDCNSEDLRRHFVAKKIMPTTYAYNMEIDIDGKEVLAKDGIFDGPPQVAITYTWGKPLLELGQTFMKALSPKVKIWIDIFFVLQCHTNINEELALAEQVYKEAERHCCFGPRSLTRSKGKDSPTIFFFEEQEWREVDRILSTNRNLWKNMQTTNPDDKKAILEKAKTEWNMDLEAMNSYIMDMLETELQKARASSEKDKVDLKKELSNFPGKLQAEAEKKAKEKEKKNTDKKEVNQAAAKPMSDSELSQEEHPGKEQVQAPVDAAACLERLGEEKETPEELVKRSLQECGYDSRTIRDFLVDYRTIPKIFETEITKDEDVHVLGQGYFAMVYKAMFRVVECAVKVLSIHGMDLLKSRTDAASAEYSPATSVEQDADLQDAVKSQHSETTQEQDPVKSQYSAKSAAAGSSKHGYYKPDDLYQPDDRSKTPRSESDSPLICSWLTRQTHLHILPAERHLDRDRQSRLEEKRLKNRLFGDLVHEALICTRIGSKENVVPFRGAMLSLEKSFLVFQYMPGNSVHRYLRLHEPADDTWQGWAHKWLYSALPQGVVHRDVRAHNFLVGGDKKEVVYICDFGLSRVLTKDKDGKYEESGLLKVGTPIAWKWCPPEVLKNKKLFSKKADIYMFGMFMYECFERKDTPNHRTAHLATDRGRQTTPVLGDTRGIPQPD